MNEKVSNSTDIEDDNFSSLSIETEDDDVPYVEYDISVTPSDPSLELLAQKIGQDDIIIPFYQRKFVWKIEQASKLIESFLMGLPVPQVFLYVNNEDQLEVIDGQQRLMSVKFFFDEYFGEEDDKGRRQVFKLKGLSERSEYNGKKFSELETRDQRRLKNSTLRAIHIRQLKPSTAGDSVFHIFERLNTGGTQLKAQEIRNAVYRGKIVSALKDLNSLEAWQSVLGLKKPDKSQKDIELVLRLFSLFEEWEQYEKPMLRHLNRFMDDNRDFNSEKTDRFMQRFKSVSELVNEKLSKPFRPKGVLNSAVLEAVMIALMENGDIEIENLSDLYNSLLDDEEFQSRISGGTTDTAVLHRRIEIAKRVFSIG